MFLCCTVIKPVKTEFAAEVLLSFVLIDDHFCYYVWMKSMGLVSLFCCKRVDCKFCSNPLKGTFLDSYLFCILFIF